MAPLPERSRMFTHAPDNRQQGGREAVPIVGTQFRLKTFSKGGREKTVRFAFSLQIPFISKVNSGQHLLPPP